MKTQWFALLSIASASLLAGCYKASNMVAAGGMDGGKTEVASYGASLTGAKEVPPSGSSATGTADFILMDDGSIRWSLRTTGLDDVVAAHVRAGVPGLNGPVVATLFSGGPTSNLDVQGVITDANVRLTLIELFNTHNAYLNVNTSAFQAGEIRGEITPETGPAAAWSRVTDVPVNEIYSVFVDGNTIVAGGDQFAYVSTDAGGTFTRSAAMAPGVPLVSVKMLDGRIYAGTANRGVFVSDDLGRTWLDFNQGLVGGFADSQLDIADLLIDGSNVYVATVGSGAWIRNVNSGTWARFGNVFGPAQSTNMQAIDAGGSRLLASAGFNGQVFFRDPGQTDWTESLLENDRFAAGLAPLRAIWTGHGWVEGTNIGVFISQCGQSPWTLVDLGVPRPILAASFALRGDRLFGCFVNGGSTIETSRDNGATWQVFESQPGVLTNTIAVAGSATLYAGRLDGLYRRSIVTTSDVP